MAEKYLIKETVPFVQFSSVNKNDTFNPLFDIEKLAKQTLEDYCQQLIYRSFSITHSQIPDFICHHCKLVKDPVPWLNKLEKLLSVNDELFSSARNQNRYMKFMVSIETKRNKILDENAKTAKTKPAKKYINAESEDRYFSFYELKKTLEGMCCDDSKIILLTKEKFDYQQSTIEFLNIHTLEFDKQCDKEIEHILALKALEAEMAKKSAAIETSQIVCEKIRLHGPLNIITNAFKQMMTSVQPTGKPYIQKRIKEMAHFIAENFADENGNPLSKDTLQTYLSPGRNDKDPNSDVMIKF